MGKEGVLLVLEQNLWHNSSVSTERRRSMEVWCFCLVAVWWKNICGSIIEMQPESSVVAAWIPKTLNNKTLWVMTCVVFCFWIYEPYRLGKYLYFCVLNISSSFFFLFFFHLILKWLNSWPSAIVFQKHFIADLNIFREELSVKWHQGHLIIFRIFLKLGVSKGKTCSSMCFPPPPILLSPQNFTLYSPSKFIVARK